MNSNDIDYTDYDYSYAISLLKTNVKFRRLCDLIAKEMEDNEISPFMVREACNLAIFRNVQHKIFPYKT